MAHPKGPRAKLTALPAGVFQIHASDAATLIGALLLLLPTFFVRFDLWQRLATAKSDRVARNAFTASGLISVVFFLAFALVGMLAHANGVTDARFAGLHAVESFAGKWSYGLMVAAFFAAVMSSADTFLGVCGLATAKLFLYRGIELDPRRATVSVGRLRAATGITGAIALVLAFLMRDIIDLFVSAFGLLSIFLPAFVSGLLKANPDVRRAWISIAFGTVSLVACVVLAPSVAFILPFVISAITYQLSRLVLPSANESDHVA